MALAVTGFAVALVVPRPAAADVETLEKAIKAAYLPKLGDFVEWPPEAMRGPDFVLCVVGDPALGDLLARAARGATVHGHPITLLYMPTLDQDRGCQLLFVSNPQGQAISQVLSLVRGRPVLTVTDQQTDSASRGIINFVVRDGRVRFEVDRRAAATNHLVISSKLLGLAANVQE